MLRNGISISKFLPGLWSHQIKKKKIRSMIPTGCRSSSSPFTPSPSVMKWWYHITLTGRKIISLSPVQLLSLLWNSQCFQCFSKNIVVFSLSCYSKCPLRYRKMIFLRLGLLCPTKSTRNITVFMYVKFTTFLHYISNRKHRLLSVSNWKHNTVLIH